MFIIVPPMTKTTILVMFQTFRKMQMKIRGERLLHLKVLNLIARVKSIIVANGCK